VAAVTVVLRKRVVQPIVAARRMWGVVPQLGALPMWAVEQIGAVLLGPLNRIGAFSATKYAPTWCNAACHPFKLINDKRLRLRHRLLADVFYGD
jgi:hypothetical protein